MRQNRKAYVHYGVLTVINKVTIIVVAAMQQYRIIEGGISVFIFDLWGILTNEWVYYSH